MEFENLFLDREDYIDNIIKFGLKYNTRKYGEYSRKWLKKHEYKILIVGEMVCYES